MPLSRDGIPWPFFQAERRALVKRIKAERAAERKGCIVLTCVLLAALVAVVLCGPLLWQLIIQIGVF